MKVILTMSALLLLVSGNVWAGVEFDKCIKEEKNLKRQEAGDCSGLAYLLNPSACFATQKKLREYLSTGKCKNIGITENVDFSIPPDIPVKKAGLEAALQKSGCEQLKDENTHLKTEISRLKAENDQLRKADQ